MPTSAEIAILLLVFTGAIDSIDLHFDTPIPPQGGPRRARFLHDHGIEQLQAAKRIGSQARDLLGCPHEHRLDSPQAPWWSHSAIVRERPATCTARRRPERNAEHLAREALSCAVRAFNLLEDAPEADDAHRLIHELGMSVSRHFGCKIELENGEWLWRCPVTIAHMRFGRSVGFTAKRICSICRQNIYSDRCPHMAGSTYQVTVSDTCRCPCGRTCMRHP